jgi:hypothetical protein
MESALCGLGGVSVSSVVQSSACGALDVRQQRAAAERLSIPNPLG